MFLPPFTHFLSVGQFRLSWFYSFFFFDKNRTEEKRNQTEKKKPTGNFSQEKKNTTQAVNSSITERETRREKGRRKTIGRDETQRTTGVAD